MSDVIDQAITDRERPLRDDVVVPYGAGYVRLTVAESGHIVKQARRRYRRHNAGFTMVEVMVAASVLVIAVGLAIHGFSFVCRGSQQEERQDE